MSERDIQNAVRLAASENGYTMFRNNVGTGWTGAVSDLPVGTKITLPSGMTYTLNDPSKLIRRPRPLNAGLCTGSSDLIGWRPMEVAIEHVGMVIARFCAVEVKAARGRVTGPQQTFLDAVLSAGGLALVARSPSDLPA